MTPEYKKGFDDAIEKVIALAQEEERKMIQMQWNLESKKFGYKALALLDFKLLLIHLFQTPAAESKTEC